MTPARFDHEAAVAARYSAAARQREEALCCPTAYDPRYLEVIPQEVLDRDYGCGDPSAHLRPGERVLDLGSGGGKICFIAAQVVGREGHVVGIDTNQDMLSLARGAAAAVAERLGYANVEFLEGRIQDLASDPAAAAEWLQRHPVRGPSDVLAYERFLAAQRTERPLVPDGSVDVVVSNCVLNLVHPEDKERLFGEMARVLRDGGRAVISDIVSDEDAPESIRTDPELWSGCIAGAFREDRFVEAFERAGFHGSRMLKRDREPWRTVDGVEFRSVTVEAFKAAPGPCLERLQAVIYRGPFREAVDDDGHRFRRGVRTAVCDKTFRRLKAEPYVRDFEFVEPLVVVPPGEARPFDCSRDSVRSARETKGEGYAATTNGSCTRPGCC
jgi:SAM-dependent methyltransferase